MQNEIPRIGLLEAHVADLIAAGEVVERPASVVKELIENAADAGATRIEVEIKRGGMALIRVSDDGCGIHPDDLATAFLRHATSKVRTASDLEGIVSMGFRGEALASVAAVAKVSVATRRRGEVEGASYEIAGGVGGSVEPIGCPEGTSIVVEELFYNTPARLKFLKKDSAEATRVGAAVASAALARPEIAFRFIADGELQLYTRGSGRLASAVSEVWGSSFAAGLIEIKNEQNGIKVHGFVSKPMFGRGNRAKQEFFVNARPIASRMLAAAVEQGYKNKMVQGRFPACVVHIEISPAAIDANVHPAKTEVRFAFEKDVFDAVYMAVVSALDGGDMRSQIARPAPRFEPEKPLKQTTIGRSAGYVRTGRGEALPQSVIDLAEKQEAERKAKAAAQAASSEKSAGAASAEPVGEKAASPSGEPAATPPHTPAAYADFIRASTPTPDPAPTPKTEVQRGFGPSDDEATAADVGDFFRRVREEVEADFAAGRIEKYLTPDGEIRFDSPETDGETTTVVGAKKVEKIEENVENVEEIAEESEPPAIADYRILGEIFGTYILVEQGDELIFIDKHAAHERMIFDRLVAEAADPLTQLLIAPLIVELEREDAAAILENIELIGSLGFEIEHFGGRSFAVRALPEELEREDAQPVLEQIADDLRRHRRVDMLERREEMLRLIACKAAIKANMQISEPERNALVERVLGLRDVKFCPHGRPVAMVLDRAELERRINRRV